jgi:hypothetical protein
MTGSPEPFSERGSAEEIEHVAADVARRIPWVCNDWLADDIDTIAHCIARTKVRWAETDRRAKQKQQSH